MFFPTTQSLATVYLFETDIRMTNNHANSLIVT